MNMSMILVIAAVSIALAGLGLGVYLTIRIFAKSSKVKRIVNGFIVLGMIEGIILAWLALILFSPAVIMQSAAIGNTLGVGTIVGLLFSSLLVSLHRRREKIPDLLKFVLLTWLEYFLAIGVLLTFGFVIGSIILSVATVPGVSTTLTPNPSPTSTSTPNPSPSPTLLASPSPTSAP